MGKDLNYPEFLGGNVSKEQKDKVKNSGLSNSEFIRNAIDFYDDVRLNSNLEYKIKVIDECIGVLKVYRENLKNQHFHSLKVSAENLKNEGVKPENLKGDSMGVYKENTETFKKTMENLKGEKNLKAPTLKESTENLKGIENGEYENPFKPIHPTVARIIANKGHLTNEDYSYQAGRVGKTTGELKKYISENLGFFEKEATKYRKN